MIIALWIIVGVLAVVIAATLVLVYKLNLYIAKVEQQFQEQVQLTGNLKQSLKELVADGFLLDDGRLKKLNIQQERNMIYNGLRADEVTHEL
jgi:cell division protein FtsL